MLSTEDQNYQRKYKKTYLCERNFHRYNYFTDDDDEFMKYFKNFANKSTKKISNYSFSKINGPFICKNYFSKKMSYQFLPLRMLVITITGPEVNASVKHISFTLTKANTKACFSIGQIV